MAFEDPGQKRSGGSFFSAIKRWMDRTINYRMAFAGSAVLGGVVFAVNYPHGLGVAMTSSLKQAVYTFFVAGFITRSNENLAVRLIDPRASLILATVVSSCLAIGLTYFIHSLKGTAEPLLSTLPTILMAPPGFGVLAWRRQAEEPRPTGPDQLRKS